MGQPGEGHGFDPVGVYTVSGGTANLGGWQQGGQAIHQRAVVGAAAADQQGFGVRLRVLQGFNDGQRSQFKQGGLNVLAFKCG